MPPSTARLRPACLPPHRKTVMTEFTPALDSASTPHVAEPSAAAWINPPADLAIATPMAPDDGPPGLTPQRIAELAPMVEALLITSARAVSPQRLSVALGLAPPEADNCLTPSPPATLPTDDASPAEAHLDAPPTRKRTRKPKVSAVSPIELIAAAIASLNADYERTGRSFRIEALSGGYRLMTLPQFRGPIVALQGLALSNKLSRPAIETLAIIAYRQPMTRAQLEAIRGVACGEVLRSLLDRRLITVAGRSEELGRPMLYATTRGFLEAFGLASLKDLPAPEELGLRVSPANT